MKRIFLKRSDIVHHDIYVVDKNHTYIQFTRYGEKEFSHGVLRVFSDKTGNVSREIIYDTVEIENVSGLFLMLYSDRKIRTKESIADENGNRLVLIPVARVKHCNYVVYKVWRG